MRLPDALRSDPFSRATAYAHGITSCDLRQMVEDNTIHRIAQNLYIRDPVQLDITARAQALSLVLTRHHVICDRTAAWIHGVDTYSYPDECATANVEAVALADHTRTRRRGCTGGVRDLQDEDVVVICGMAVTSPVRTALDLACKLKPMSALACVETFLRERLVTKDELAAMLPRFRGRRGVRLAREVVEIASELVESEGESFTKMVIYRAGLPLPTPQLWLRREDGGWIRLDFAYEGLKVAVEYDGEQFHGPEQQEADEERREWLRREGWHVIVVHKSELSAGASQHWIDELRRVLLERGRKVDCYSRFS